MNFYVPGVKVVLKESIPFVPQLRPPVWGTLLDSSATGMCACDFPQVDYIVVVHADSLDFVAN